MNHDDDEHDRRNLKKYEKLKYLIEKLKFKMKFLSLPRSPIFSAYFL